MALFSIDSYKASKTDEFGVEFFKNYWHLIKKNLFKCIYEFFTNGHLLKESNHTFIALNPKITNPLQTSRYRPISLCSTIYEIISKIRVNGLRPLLNRLIAHFKVPLFREDWSTITSCSLMKLCISLII